MLRKGLKILYFLLFCLTLVIPLIYSFTDHNKRISLKGYVKLEEKPNFEIKDWFNGSFQEKYDKYINDNIGFRPIFVRIRNQVDYTLFDKINAASVIRGKENYLYELNYIKAYNGTDFIGVDSIYYKAQKIKALQDSLNEIDKTLIICLAAGKGSFYPKYFPDKFVKPVTDATNQKYYAKAFKELGINYIDFNRWFLDMKDTSRYILYPKYGIHWSHYGMLLSADSLISYIENKRKIDMPDLLLSDYKLTKNLNKSDYDIAGGLNLIFRLPVKAMCYPQIKWQNDEGKEKPKVVVIADSFYWSMYDIGIAKKSFSLGAFWYYNRLVYPDSFKEETKVNNLNFGEQIQNTDVFVLLATEANLPKFPWGFVENILGEFEKDDHRLGRIKTDKDLKYPKELQKYIDVIKNNREWMKDIEEKAKKNNISVDSMLIMDAQWLIENKKN